MAKQQAPLDALKDYLPEGTFEKVSEYLHHYRIHLTITRERTTVLGDYRNAVDGKNHRISVNGNLNKFAFLYTLIHEIAHLLVYDQFGHRVASHGKEWNSRFSLLVRDFLHHPFVPPGIQQPFSRPAKTPAASSCAEDDLLRVFRNYDPHKKDMLFVEEIEPGNLFALRDGRIFRRGEKIRKRYKCTEVSTGKEYLFSPVYEIKSLDQ